MRPGLNGSVGLCCGDDVSSCLFDYAEPVEFQLTDDRCLPCTWRAGDDEPSHLVFFFSEPVSVRLPTSFAAFGKSARQESERLCLRRT
jgi:hypothetical protein